jgi:SAM-dependent methyltransferase
METMRKPFQGISNIIRFNWHFYMLSIGLILFILLLNNYLEKHYQIYGIIVCFLIVFTTIISLLISYFVYDLSDLYTLNWLDKIDVSEAQKIVNINAGFDETSALIKAKFPRNELIVFDFYDPQKHTEISIKRARKTYPPYPETKSIMTSKLPLENNSIDLILLTLAAHEIRDETERILFFKTLNSVLKSSGKIVITEHLRDFPNFLTYNIGFFHFFSKKLWLNTFKAAGLNIVEEMKITPFISVFILNK